MATDRVKGHLDGLLLAVLEAGPAHGYAVIEALQQRSGGTLDLPTGTVYPALRRLEDAGWIKGVWSDVSGRRRRTYSLTSAGRRALAAERRAWGDRCTAIASGSGSAGAGAPDSIRRKAGLKNMSAMTLT
jgi:DNA-binding PadR family transcriptional regulator